MFNLAYWGRTAKTHNTNLISLKDITEGKYDKLIDKLTQWDPLEYGSHIKNLKDFYRSSIILMRPGTIFAEVFEPNHEYHRF